MPLYTTFPASGDANGFDNIYVPNGTLCVSCSNPMTVWAAANAGATKVALGFGVSQASKDCVTRSGAGVHDVGRRRGNRVRLQERRPRVSAASQRARAGGHRDEGRGRRLLTPVRRPEQRVDARAGAPAPGHGRRDDRPAAGLRRHRVPDGERRRPPGRPARRGVRLAEADPGDSLPTMLEWWTRTAIGYNDYAIQGWLGADLAVTGILRRGRSSTGRA